MIYVDLDNVCADFNKAVLDITGSTYKGEETWEILEKVPNLFYRLEVMQGTVESINKLITRFGWERIQILTALPLTTGNLVSSHIDKVSWVHDNIDERLQVNCVQRWSHKKYFCKDPWDILIDDSERNIFEWNQAGGEGILHVNWKSTIERLKL